MPEEWSSRKTDLGDMLFPKEHISCENDTEHELDCEEDDEDEDASTDTKDKVSSA